jgi:hypothetical protein
MWYSWHNLSDKYNTNKLKYFEGKEWKIIIFPEGNYDFDDIQGFINDHFQTDDPPISIHANTVTLRTIVLLKPGFKLIYPKIARGNCIKYLVLSLKQSINQKLKVNLKQI